MSFNTISKSISAIFRIIKDFLKRFFIIAIFFSFVENQLNLDINKDINEEEILDADENIVNEELVSVKGRRSNVLKKLRKAHEKLRDADENLGIAYEKLEDSKKTLEIQSRVTTKIVNFWKRKFNDQFCINEALKVQNQYVTSTKETLERQLNEERQHTAFADEALEVSETKRVRQLRSSIVTKNGLVKQLTNAKESNEHLTIQLNDERRRHAAKEETLKNTINNLKRYANAEENPM